MSTVAEPFGQRLRRLREQAGYASQESLAMAGGWKGNQFVSNLENRHTPPSLKTLQRLSRLIGCSVGDLQGQGDDVTPPVTDRIDTPSRGETTAKQPSLEGDPVSDPFVGLRWEWEQLNQADRIAAVHRMQDVLRSFSMGAETGQAGARSRARKAR